MAVYVKKGSVVYNGKTYNVGEEIKDFDLPKEEYGKLMKRGVIEVKADAPKAKKEKG